MARSRIPNVDVFRRDIEIAAKDDGSIGFDDWSQPAREPIKPDELGLVEWRINNAAVRRINTDEAHATAFRRDHPCFSEWLVVSDVGRLSGAKRFTKVRDHAFN